MSVGLISFERAKGFLRGFRWTQEQADELIALVRAGTEQPTCTRDPNPCKVGLCNWPKCMQDD